MQFPSLAPLPYHREVVDYLRTEEPDVWRWACSAQAREEHAAAVRGDLLRQTYRLDADAHPELHACCEAAARGLGLNLPVTLYQAGEGTMNAGLFYMPGEAHVVFFGAILERLKGPQLEALKEKHTDVHFLGVKQGDELAACFANADCFVFPSLTDTFGLVILEAMAAGTPVAGYNVPGPRDLIPGSKLVLLEGVRHFLFEDEPERCAG